MEDSVKQEDLDEPDDLDTEQGGTDAFDERPEIPLATRVGHDSQGEAQEKDESTDHEQGDKEG